MIQKFQAFLLSVPAERSLRKGWSFTSQVSDDSATDQEMRSLQEMLSQANAQIVHLESLCQKHGLDVPDRQSTPSPSSPSSGEEINVGRSVRSNSHVQHFQELNRQLNSQGRFEAFLRMHPPNTRRVIQLNTHLRGFVNEREDEQDSHSEKEEDDENTLRSSLTRAKVKISYLENILRKGDSSQSVFHYGQYLKWLKMNNIKN